MTARARVDNGFGFHHVSVWLGRSTAEDRFDVVLPVDMIMQATEANAAAAPSLQLPEDMARALLDALATHFGGTSEAQTLRKDYLAERARVDLMIGHLTQSAS